MKELRDQAAHFTAAVVALAPVAALPGPVTFMWAGFCCGMIREITEEGDPVTLAKAVKALHSWKDILFWSLGGLLVGIIND